MDRVSIIVLIICVAVIFLLKPLADKLYPPKPLPPGATNVQTAPITATTTNAGAATSATVTATAPTVATPVPVANTNIPEQVVVVSTDEGQYTFTSHGGGLKTVELTPKKDAKNATNEVVTLNKNSPAPVLAILDGEAVQGDGIFALTKLDHGVRAEKVLPSGLAVVKEFEVTNNYLVSAKVRMENRSPTNLSLPQQEWLVGTATPLDAKDNGQNVGVLWYNGSKTEDVGGTSYFSGSGFMCLPKTPPREYRGGSNNVVWAAAQNQYFVLALFPERPGQALAIRRIDLPRPTGEEARTVATNGPPPQGYETAIIYPPVTLTNGQVFEQRVQLYAGPKEYQTLNQLSERLGNKPDQIMSFGMFGFVSKGLLLGMNWMHQALKIPYGWTIVAITVLIKLVFWPLTASSTRSAKRMQALQPQIKAIQEKHKEDPMKAQKKVMEFYKENKVNPLGSCLPMLLQIPVFFGFFSMIRTAVELRGAHWLWVKDLAKPDTLFWIPGLGFIPFIGVSGVGLPFNLLPLIMGATMFWQARLTPPSPGMDPTQQAIMKYLPLIFLVSLYNFSAGMTLYWTTNNLLTILQTKLTRTIEVKPPAPPTPTAAKPASPVAPQRKANVRKR
jgi:YidC/Oxa1 family membrane protein insertase